MFRELHEEVGYIRTMWDLACTRDWLRYEVPERFIRRDARGHYRGQKQIWYLLQLTGRDCDMNLRATDHPEFDAWRWHDYWVPLDAADRVQARRLPDGADRARPLPASRQAAQPLPARACGRITAKACRSAGARKRTVECRRPTKGWAQGIEGAGDKERERRRERRRRRMCACSGRMRLHRRSQACDGRPGDKGRRQQHHVVAVDHLRLADVAQQPLDLG